MSPACHADRHKSLAKSRVCNIYEKQSRIKNQLKVVCSQNTQAQFTTWSLAFCPGALSAAPTPSSSFSCSLPPPCTWAIWPGLSLAGVALWWWKLKLGHFPSSPDRPDLLDWRCIGRWWEGRTGCRCCSCGCSSCWCSDSFCWLVVELHVVWWNGQMGGGWKVPSSCTCSKRSLMKEHAK